MLGCGRATVDHLVKDGLRDRFISCVPPERRVKYLTLLFTGLRRKELKNTVVSDVDLISNTFLVRGEVCKTGEHALIPCIPSCGKPREPGSEWMQTHTSRDSSRSLGSRPFMEILNGLGLSVWMIEAASSIYTRCGGRWLSAFCVMA